MCDVVYFLTDEGAATEVMTYSIFVRSSRYLDDRRLPTAMVQADRRRVSTCDGGRGARPTNQASHIYGEHEIGYLCTKSIVAGGEPVTAIFAGSDAVAQGVYHALGEAGLRVPEDVSVAGFNDVRRAHSCTRV